MMKTPNLHRFDVGSFRCAVIKDFDFRYPPASFASNAAPVELDAMMKKFHGQTDFVPSPFLAFWIDTGKEQILIDTGTGFSEDPISFQGHELYLKGQLLPEMKKAGIDPSAIDWVVLTHFHPDHIGGIFNEQEQQNFPNAQFAFHRKEWDFWFSDQAGQMPPLFLDFVRKQVAPLQSRYNRKLQGEREEIVPGVEAIFLPGHTPGHIGLEIASEGEKMLYATDTILHPMLMEKPDWISSFDVDPELARSTKISLLEKAAKEQLLLCNFHFPFPGLGYVKPEDDHWVWEAQALMAKAVH